MALSITASNVVPGSNAVLANATAGEAITAGMPILVVSGVAYKTNCDAEDRNGVCHGIAAHSTLTGQPCNYQTSGTLALGSVLSAGRTYYVGNSDGDIIEESDLAENYRVTRLGTASTSGNLEMEIDATGIQRGA